MAMQYTYIVGREPVVLVENITTPTVNAGRLNINIIADITMHIFKYLYFTEY